MTEKLRIRVVFWLMSYSFVEGSSIAELYHSVFAEGVSSYGACTWTLTCLCLGIVSVIVIIFNSLSQEWCVIISVTKDTETSLESFMIAWMYISQKRAFLISVKIKPFFYCKKTDSYDHENVSMQSYGSLYDLNFYSTHITVCTDRRRDKLQNSRELAKKFLWSYNAIVFFKNKALFLEFHTKVFNFVYLEEAYDDKWSGSVCIILI